MNVVTRINNSVSFRSGPIYKALLSCLPIVPLAVPLPINDRLNYLTFTGREQLSMLRASLWTLRRVSKRTPMVIIGCDPSLDESTLLRAIKWWRGPVEIWSSGEIMAYSDEHLPEEIALYCRKHVLGLKLAAVMRAGLRGLTIYADTDVLWLRDTEVLLPESPAADAPFLRLQQDRQMAYDTRLVALWPFLEGAPYCCSGVAVITGDLRRPYSSISGSFLTRIFDCPNHFTEQTVLAAVQRTIGMACLDSETAHISWDDQFQIGPTCFNRKWALRHYVGPVRHLFWRDAFYLYLKGIRGNGL